MKQLKEISVKHPLRFSIVFMAAALGLHGFLKYRFVQSREHFEIITYGIPDILTSGVSIILVIMVMFLTGMYSQAGFILKGIGKGILFGWYSLVIGPMLLTAMFLSADKNILVFPGVPRIISFTVSMLTIGVFEEILFRGIVLNILISRWKNNKNGIMKAIILSAFLFGAAHLANLIMWPNLIITTASQVVYAFLTGFYLACIYVRSRNIWSVILLHALTNWFSMFINIFDPARLLAEKTVSDIPVSLGLGLIGLSIPGLFIGIFIIRKVTIK